MGAGASSAQNNEVTVIVNTTINAAVAEKACGLDADAQKALCDHLTERLMAQGEIIMAAASTTSAPHPGLADWWAKPVSALATLSESAQMSEGQRERHRIYAHLCPSTILQIAQRWRMVDWMSSSLSHLLCPS